MLKILVNAYAVSPDRGSEPGMGWNWCVHLAESCELFIITEGEFRSDIERTLSQLPQASRMHLFYLPVSERVRRMCWNQGTWRFYYHYARWQKRALSLAREICATHSIDIIHQLNMVGFREPGYLWRIKGPSFVLGPIGGMSLAPIQYFRDTAFSSRCKMVIKNWITRFQRKWSPRVRNAINHASTVICATPTEYSIVSNFYKKKAVLINETGATVTPRFVQRSYGPLFHLVWVGRFIHSKQLGLALRVIETLKNKPIILDIVGTGSKEDCFRYRQMVEMLNISTKIKWHGQVPQSAVYEMMSHSDLFFFTSVLEATSTVIMEALSCGLPVVCFDTCGFGPLIDSDFGVKIPLSTPEKSIAQFSAAIKHLVDNPSRLSNMSQQAVLKAKTLDWESKTARVLSIYQEVVNRSR